jgi:hypothetical protein
MKKILPLLGVVLFAGAVQAADVAVSVQVGQPGFYGRIDLGNTSPPPVVLAEPVWVQRGAVRPKPVYMRIPPGHQKHWDKHCREYNACGVPVYFVREEWYEQRYSHHENGGPSDKGQGKGQGKGNGKGHGKDKGHD